MDIKIRCLVFPRKKGKIPFGQCCEDSKNVVEVIITEDDILELACKKSGIPKDRIVHRQREEIVFND